METSAALGDLLDTFESLSQVERHAFFHELSCRFQPSDWWYLQQFIATRDIYRDIVGTLPVEVSIQILEYLEPAQVIRLRRVSKRWRELLGAEDLCRAVLQRWFPLDANRSGPPQRSWTWLLENSASRDFAILRQEFGKRVVLQWQRTLTSAMALHHYPIRSFLEGRVATIEAFDRSISVVDLAKCELLAKELATPERQLLTDVCLMKDYVMARVLGGGQTYVWNIATRECKLIRKPNSYILNAVADGNSFLATLHGEPQAILYNAVQNRMISIEAEPPFPVTPPNRQDVRILDDKRERLIVVRHGLMRKDSGHVKTIAVYTYSTTNGKLLGRKDCEMAHFAEACKIETNARWGEDSFIIDMCAPVLDVDIPSFDGAAQPHLDNTSASTDTNKGVYTLALIFDRRTHTISQQRLWFKNLAQIPLAVYMYEGTVYTMPDELAVATKVPMSTGESYHPVVTTKRPGPGSHPLHIVPPRTLVFTGSDGQSDDHFHVDTYYGVREREERFDARLGDH